MKTTLLIFTALVLSINSSAQLNKGSMMISGRFNYSKNNSTTKDTSIFASNPINDGKSFNLNLSYGYFVADNIVVGIYGGYGNSNSKSENTQFNGSGFIYNRNSFTNSGLSAGVFSRYYKWLGKSKFAIFGSLTAGYNSGKQQQKQSSQYGASIIENNSHADYSVMSIGFNPGLVYFFTKRIAVETSFGNMGYSTRLSRNYSANDSYSETRNSSFDTNLSLSLSNLYWGVNFYFGGKKENALQSTNANE
jgi:hypothetical protein